MKKAFSLFELIVVIILIGIIYAVFLPKLSTVQKKNESLTLLNIKEYLLSLPYKNTLSLKCIEESYECYINIDGVIKNDLTIKNLFKDKPEVYSYDKELERLEFARLELDTFEEFGVVFELSLNKDRKTQDVVVETTNGVYVFNSLYLKPVKYEYINDVQNNFEDMITEVKDAF